MDLCGFDVDVLWMLCGVYVDDDGFDVDVLWLMWIHNVEFPHVHIYTFDSVDDVDLMWMFCGCCVEFMWMMWMFCGCCVELMWMMWIRCGCFVADVDPQCGVSTRPHLHIRQWMWI